ncbi:hypothetical protein N0V90_005438 [Kalmusia sp. IMI 367209]|nr:hypothetical protein N0V90_005438 [Kalmusia sp. IMI 367209]
MMTNLLPSSVTSHNSTYSYRDASWVVYNMLEPNEKVENKKTLNDDFELPFIRDDDFNYYPKLNPRPHGPYSNEEMAPTEESLVLGKAVKRTKSVKKKVWEDFSLEDVVLRALAKLRLKK